ncbi:MAG TPA: anthranilate phosphoribosyltransferase [Tepidisphaeraceae bacterium]|nr:anthranilate phosphoribosyltransferase [Tepidisphaeraceae bacterium]
MRDILLKLSRREDLTRDEAAEAFERIMSGQATEAQIGGLLVGLAAKGTTAAELASAARVMRGKVLGLGFAPTGVILDTCGTGGDVRGTFNISTAAAIIAAAAGVQVVKHGNRSASGRSGSADVLEKLGVRIDAPPQCLQKCLEHANICFAFARAHHPAMRHVAAARSTLGIPTIFNLLGPLTNPGGAKHQLLGVFASELTDRLAEVLADLGSERAWVVHADDGLDELSTISPTRISELKPGGRIHTWKLDSRELKLPSGRLSDLQADSADDSARIIRAIFAGEKGPPRDIALLNAAAALVVAEASPNLPTALARAAEAIDSGQAVKTLEKLTNHSAAN